MNAVVARATNEMPSDIMETLIEEDLVADYERRPRYQRNDYLGWIGRAKRPETRRQRVDQMIAELRRGGVYMKMSHPASARD